MFTLNCNGRLLVAGSPLVMGIINTTPDSFYSNSRFSGVDAVLAQTEKMIRDGADIVDIGGQSTRPGSIPVDAEEELQRVIDSIEAVHKNFPDAFISIDTYYSLVAKTAVNAGASIINDISAGRMDENMIPAVAALQVPYVLMHMKGTPLTMQQNPHYDNVTREVLDFFIHQTALLRQAGIKDIIIDPGLGFGKTIQHNFELLRNLMVFEMIDCPLLLGISRKSTIYRTLNNSPEDALNGTTVLNTVGLLNGADIIRVHDVKEAKEAVILLNALGKIENRNAKIENDVQPES
jgi:dihydropteroate synthase